jgi:TonB family protein
MLNPRFVRTGLSAPAVAFVLVALTAVALPAAAVRIGQAGPTPLAGVVYDPTGAVVPEVELALRDDRQNSWTATSDSAGRFEFAPVQPGRYTLQAQRPGFRALEQTLTLATAPDWHRAVTLQVGTLTETVTVRTQRPKAPRRAEAAPTPIRVGGNIKPPTKLQHVNPVYPEAMRDAGVEGTVPLEALIGADGGVASVRVITAQVHPDLAQAAMAAVRQWRFSPTLLNGRAVEVVMNVSIDFQLED